MWEIQWHRPTIPGGWFLPLVQMVISGMVYGIDYSGWWFQRSEKI
jgi:uncharacterized ion transporter superfamily protein YfcC